MISASGSWDSGKGFRLWFAYKVTIKRQKQNFYFMNNFGQSTTRNFWQTWMEISGLTQRYLLPSMVSTGTLQKSRTITYSRWPVNMMQATGDVEQTLAISSSVQQRN